MEEDLILLQDEIQVTNDAVMSLIEAARKLQMMNPRIHNNIQGDQGGERGLLPRSTCTMINEVKPMKITNHKKMKYEGKCGEQ